MWAYIQKLVQFKIDEAIKADSTSECILELEDSIIHWGGKIAAYFP